jgi:hypothetical protein
MSTTSLFKSRTRKLRSPLAQFGLERMVAGRALVEAGLLCQAGRVIGFGVTRAK